MPKEVRRARIQALMDLDDCKDQVDPIEMDKVFSSPLNRRVACMACIIFFDGPPVGVCESQQAFVCYWCDQR